MKDHASRPAFQPCDHGRPSFTDLEPEYHGSEGQCHASVRPWLTGQLDKMRGS